MQNISNVVLVGVNHGVIDDYIILLEVINSMILKFPETCGQLPRP